MLTERIWTGNALRNFHYLIACAETGERLAVDPLEWRMCLDAARRRGWEITQILNTHEHEDHTGGNEGLKAATRAKVLGSPPAEFVHAYMIEKPSSEKDFMKWTFESAMFGTLLGRFAVLGQSILSVFGCETSGYHGAEHLGQLDAGHYRSAGMMLLKDKVIYTWQMNLERAT